MWELVGTQTVCFLTHRLTFKLDKLGDTLCQSTADNKLSTNAYYH